MKPKIVSFILALTLLFTAFISSPEIKAADSANFQITGIWYCIPSYYSYWKPEIYDFSSDGTYINYEINDPDNEYDRTHPHSYLFDSEKNQLILGTQSSSNTYDIVEISDDGNQMTWKIEWIDSVDGSINVITTKLYKNYQDLIDANQKIYQKSDEYKKTLADKNGFYIKKGILYAYYGDKKTVKIPKKVKRIYKSAFENRSEKVETIIIPGTVKKIDAQAFTFCYVSTIKIKEGVRTIGKECFSDTYFSKIYLPKSLKKIGSDIFATEEGLHNAKIYVHKNSKAHKYMKKNKPYGNPKIKFY